MTVVITGYDPALTGREALRRASREDGLPEKNIVAETDEYNEFVRALESRTRNNQKENKKAMKITHYQKRETTTVTVRVTGIQTKPNTLGEGMEHVVLCTDQGQFSTFMPTWKRLGIDAAKLNPGDLMEIDYYEKEWNGMTYKNFSKARLVENVAAPSAAPEETVSEAELAGLVDA